MASLVPGSPRPTATVTSIIRRCGVWGQHQEAWEPCPEHSQEDSHGFVPHTTMPSPRRALQGGKGEAMSATGWAGHRLTAASSPPPAPGSGPLHGTQSRAAPEARLLPPPQQGRTCWTGRRARAPRPHEHRDGREPTGNHWGRESQKDCCPDPDTPGAAFGRVRSVLCGHPASVKREADQQRSLLR